MKINFKIWSCTTLAALALAAFCGTAKADLINQTNTQTVASYIPDPNGNAPFYSTPLASLSGTSGPTLATGAANNAMGETFTITNGAGGLTITSGASNYVLTGVSLIVSGYSTATNVWLHLFDVTSNLTSTSGTVYNGSGAHYSFTNSGDLLGEGYGLSFSNATFSGGTQQVYVGLINGPTTYGDQVVLQANHTYSLEVWSPAPGGQIFWFKGSAADVGGQGMGSANSSLGTARGTLASFGLVGGAPRTFAMGLYGHPTTNAASVNTSTNMVGYTNYFIDQFNDLAALPGNPYYTNTANPAGVDYSAGGISSIWGIFFGQAVTYTWDNTTDAQGNLNGGHGGSMLLQTTFTTGSQLVAWDGGNGIAPPLNGQNLGFTSFECDIMIDGSSGTQTNLDGSAYYGNLQYGQRTAGGFGQDYYSLVTKVPQAQSNQWIHVTCPINPQSDANLAQINDVVFHIYGPFGNLGINENDMLGNLTMWIDNIKFKAPLALPLIPPPSLSLIPATPGTLRMFAVAPQYTRTELITVDSNEGWIGGPGDSGDPTAPYSKPVSYSFTLSSISTSAGAQTHIMILPGETGNYNGQDFSGPTELWLQINSTGNSSNVNANIAWKINDPGANPTNTALSVTNVKGVGTWTLSFTSQTNGTLMAPGWTTASNFFISDPTAATDWANPTYAVFGIQANSVPGNFGRFNDYTQISISNTAGTNFTDTFLNDTDISTNLWSLRMDTTAPTGNFSITNAADGITNTPPANILPLFLVTTNTPFWVTWNVTTNGYGLGESVSGLASLGTNLVSPAYLSGTNISNTYNVTPQQINAGPAFWALIPKDDLSKTNSSFFEVVNPPPLK